MVHPIKKTDARRRPIDELEHAVHHAAVLDAPGRNLRRARQAVSVADFVEAASLQKRAPPGPAQIARRDERRAIAAVAKHGRERRSRKPRVLFRDLAEVELGIGGHENRDQSVRASANMRVEVVERETPPRLCRKVRRRVVVAVQAGPARGDRFEHDEDHVQRPGHSRGASSPRSRGAGQDDGRPHLGCRGPVSDGLEVGQIGGREPVGQVHGLAVTHRMPPRRDEHPVRVLGDRALLPGRPIGGERVVSEDHPDAEDAKATERRTQRAPLHGRMPRTARWTSAT